MFQALPVLGYVREVSTLTKLALHRRLLNRIGKFGPVASARRFLLAVSIHLLYERQRTTKYGYNH
jgi:hypothetical protein